MILISAPSGHMAMAQCSDWSGYLSIGFRAYAQVARDQSDRGAIAMMGELVYRPLKAKLEELKK